MSISTAVLVGSAPRLAFLPQLCATDNNVSASLSALVPSSKLKNFPYFCRHTYPKNVSLFTRKISLSNNDAASKTEEAGEPLEVVEPPKADDAKQTSQKSADWQIARMYKERGLIHLGRVIDSNSGAPQKSIHEIARALIRSNIHVKVLEADEEKRKLVFSEKEAMWLRFSEIVNVGDIFEARVGAVEDFCAFAHLRCPDGGYHLCGRILLREISWDLVFDPRDVLTEGEEVRVKILSINREKKRIELSLKQLEEDPLLETLEKVIPQDGSAARPVDGSAGYDIQPLPGLESIIEGLLLEDGISDVKITRQGFEKRVVSPDLQLWLSNAPSTGEQFVLLARAGRQVQEILLVTSLDQEGIKKALQRVLERVP